ncbi:MAG TPA: hypothetical protein DDY18_06530 [Flavobacterium sp.]|nr:hypothetical protein [Flavobacterium sp.]
MLYPNPVTNDLNISIANFITVEQISIYSLIGQLVKSVDGSNVTTINMDDLTSGVYMVKIQTNQGVIDQKIIKK